jgi:hypothetical protein
LLLQRRFAYQHQELLKHSETPDGEDDGEDNLDDYSPSETPAGTPMGTPHVPSTDIEGSNPRKRRRTERTTLAKQCFWTHVDKFYEAQVIEFGKLLSGEKWKAYFAETRLWDETTFKTNLANPYLTMEVDPVAPVASESAARPGFGTGGMSTIMRFF